MKYYNFSPFHRVVKDFIAQTGDPLGSEKGGTSIWGYVGHSCTVSLDSIFINILKLTFILYWHGTLSYASCKACNAVHYVHLPSTAASSPPSFLICCVVTSFCNLSRVPSRARSLSQRMVRGEAERFFPKVAANRIKHRQRGVVAMANNGADMHGSQFFITLAENLDSLDGTVYAVQLLFNSILISIIFCFHLWLARTKYVSIFRFVLTNWRCSMFVYFEGKHSVFGEVVEDESLEVRQIAISSAPVHLPGYTHWVDTPYCTSSNETSVQTYTPTLCMFQKSSLHIVLARALSLSLSCSFYLYLYLMLIRIDQILITSQGAGRHQCCLHG